MKKGLLIFSVLALIAVAGCYNDKYDKLYVTPATVTCDTANVSYSATIFPIINQYCNINSGCHTAAGSSISGYNFTIYNGLKSVASYNYIVTDISGTPTSGHTAMPQNLPSIPQCDIEQITAWVNQGAPNN